jgi:hypothetical protein
MKNQDESKQQRKQRKALEKQGLSNNQRTDYVRGYLEAYQQSSKKNYVVCLKWGNKYGPEYVNKLYSMVKRNLTIDYEFVCYTENSKGIDHHIKTMLLPNLPVSGWWYKPWFLSNELGIQGTALFLDLDLIVFRNIDNLFSYQADKPFVIIRDFNRQIRPNWDRMNSSVFRFKIGHYNNAYQEFKQNTQRNVSRYQGDQDWMYKSISDHVFWPDEWIQSYKWEMRGRRELGFVNSRRNFTKPGQPNILQDTSIAVFHGEPNIPECIDEWPRANWN